MRDYATLDKHVRIHTEKQCSHCRKPREEERMESVFERGMHYVTWTCDNCGNESWRKTEHFSSGVPHDRF